MIHSIILVLIAILFAGCATTTAGEGRKALREGRYADAATRFEEALAKDPDKVDVLLGLGVAKYRVGQFDEAVEPLTRAVTREPKLVTPRLYLGLTQLRRGELGAVEEHFKTLVAERPGTRLAAQAERTLKLLRGGDPASNELREYMAASLENEAEAEREVADARRQARDAELRWRDPYWGGFHPYYIHSRRRC